LTGCTNGDQAGAVLHQDIARYSSGGGGGRCTTHQFDFAHDKFVPLKRVHGHPRAGRQNGLRIRHGGNDRGILGAHFLTLRRHVGYHDGCRGAIFDKPNSIQTIVGGIFILEIDTGSTEWTRYCFLIGYCADTTNRLEGLIRQVSAQIGLVLIVCGAVALRIVVVPVAARQTARTRTYGHGAGRRRRRCCCQSVGPSDQAYSGYCHAQQKRQRHGGAERTKEPRGANRAVAPRENDRSATGLFCCATEVITGTHPIKPIDINLFKKRLRLSDLIAGLGIVEVGTHDSINNSLSGHFRIRES
jgi:hypothetical protein